MRHMCLAVAISCAAVIAAPAMAEDKEPCAAEMVCASNTKSVVDAFREAGLKAKLQLDDAGNPVIESAASGYHFDTVFHGCVDTKYCRSLQFRVGFIKQPTHTIELANKWNASNRFSQMFVADDGQLWVSWDVTTVGGLTKKNFAEALGMWETVLGALNNFFQAQSPTQPTAKPGG